MKFNLQTRHSEATNRLSMTTRSHTGYVGVAALSKDLTALCGQRGDTGHRQVPLPADRAGHWYLIMPPRTACSLKWIDWLFLEISTSLILYGC